MTPRLSGNRSIFGLVFFVLWSLLRIARQWSYEKFAILSMKPWSHFGILTYRLWSIDDITGVTRDAFYIGIYQNAMLSCKCVKAEISFSG